MNKNIKKSEVIEMENNNMDEEILEENEMTKVGKPKWSLKKKLMIGGGIIAGLVLGAIALGSKKSVNTTDDQVEDSDNDDEEVTDDITVTEEITENIEE